MSGLDLGATMDALATAMRTVPGVTRAYAWPVEDGAPGDAFVGYPRDPGELGITFTRGADHATFPVVVICGLLWDRATRDRVSMLIANADNDVMSRVDGDLGGVVQSADCPRFSIEPYRGRDGLDYLAVRFDVDIIA